LGALGLAAIAPGVYLLRPRLHGDQQISWRLVCVAQLKSVGMSLHQYAYEQKALPEDAFRVLLDSGDLSAKQLICPCSGKKVADVRVDPYACYVLVPGMPTARAAGVLDGSLVLAYGLDNHDGEGASVLYADGHCTFVHPYARVIEEVENTQRWLVEEREHPSAP
jgi:prepilin-type processing-associated H-X9-DG protein